jgi:LPS export ABC transporter protein LptC
MNRLILIAAILFVACTTQEEEEGIRQLPSEDDVAIQSFGVDFFFSDSAKMVAKLHAQRVIEKNTDLGDGKETVYYLYDSLKIQFYSGTGSVNSEITANEGVFRQDRRLAELKGNVILKNNKGETLETEQLFWDEPRDSVYTDKFVRIQTPDKIITGSKGLRSNTAFTSYTIFGIRGEFEADENLN